MQAKDICLLAATQAKGPGMVAIAGQFLNVVLEDLKLNKNLKVNRVTQTLAVQAGSYGPFPLESDYLRTYDMFYVLPGSDGLPQMLNPVTMEVFDGEPKTVSSGDYPYEFATDLSTQAQVAGTTSGVVTDIQVADTSGGYLSAPIPTFGTITGSGAAAIGTLSAIGVTPWSSGAGYSEGDILTPVGGTFSRPMTFRRMEGGTVYGVIDGGSYTVPPGNPRVIGGIYSQTGNSGSVPCTGGTGAGFQALITWGLGIPIITAGGSNYDPTDFVIPVGGVSGVSPNVPGAYTLTVSQTNAGASAGNLYVYPQAPVLLVMTHRYMKNQPDIVSPETSTETPWFPFTDYLIKATAARMMGITGDDRASTWLKESEEMLRPHLIMEGDEQQTVRQVRLDPRHFKSNRGVRPTKAQPY